MGLYIACSGYYYRHWQGRWYPADMKASQWFAYYAGHFDTVEINASFYRFPTAATVRRWYRQAPGGFLYSVKAPRLITHLKRFRETDTLLRDLYGVLADELQEKLGCILFQMPPSLHYGQDVLRHILEQLDPAFCNVCEFRHPDWWRSEVYAALARAGAVFCSVHAPGLPDDIISTENTVYLRMHGIPWYRQDYTQAELSALATRLRNIGPRQAWVYFNNDTEAFAPFNAQRLAQIMADDGSHVLPQHAAG